MSMSEGKVVVHVVSPDRKIVQTSIFKRAMIDNIESLALGDLGTYLGSAYPGEIKTTITLSQIETERDFKTPHTIVYDHTRNPVVSLRTLVPVLTDYELYEVAKEYISEYQNEIIELENKYDVQTLIKVLNTAGYEVNKPQEEDED